MWKGLYSCGDRVVKVSHAVGYNGCNSMAVTGRCGCSYVYVCCFTKPVLALHVIKCNYMHAWLFIFIFLATYFALCISVSVSEILVPTVQTLKKQHSSGERQQGKKDRQLSPEPVTYALSQSFSHVSYEIGHHHSSWYIRDDMWWQSMADSVARIAETPR